MAQYDMLLLQKNAANKFEEIEIVPTADFVLGFNASKVLVAKAIAAVPPTVHATTHLAGGSDALAWSATIFQADTAANQPAAGGTNAGYLYFVTDLAGGTLQRSDGAAWVTVATGLTALTSLGGLLYANGTTVTAVGFKNDATANPAVTDDGTAGYAPGSIWVNVTTDQVFINLDASTGAAIWKEVPNPSTVLTLTTVTAASATVAITDQAILVNRAGVVALNLLPLTNYTLGQQVQIQDISGAAATNNITLTAFGAELINGSATYVIGQNYGGFILVRGASSWHVKELPRTLSLAQGGTGATTASGARTALGFACSAILTGSATLDFNVGASVSQDLTITVTGAAVNDVAVCSAPAALNANLMVSAFVSAADTVTVRLGNLTAAPIDPASATFRVFVIKP